MTYSVAIVVDREAGDSIYPLADRMHVWVCDTPVNRRVAETHWAERPGTLLETGITTFRVGGSESPEEMLLKVLDTVEQHHGANSHDPPWERLEIHGASASPAVRAALADFGVLEFEPIAGGFRCTRSFGAS